MLLKVVKGSNSNNHRMSVPIRIWIELFVGIGLLCEPPLKGLYTRFTSHLILTG